LQVSKTGLQTLLTNVQKPGRYVGEEWNSITKDWDKVQLKLALAYPDTYEIGMSNLGLAIIYDLVNKHKDFVAERVYAPWIDMEEAMRKANVPLFSLETRHTLDEFDIIGFSLQYELTYTNMLNMLDLGGIPILACERAPDVPLVIAGGSCTYNPEPLAEFFDLFVIGEGEEVLLELLESMRDWKTSRAPADARRALLLHLAQIPGIYVPSFYQASYNPDQTLAETAPKRQEVPSHIRKRIMPRLGPVLTKPIVPNIQVIHDRGAIEIQRGCGHGCRFCQAGMIYRPIRERPTDEILDAIDEMIAATGYNEIGLLSLSSSDHSGIEKIVARSMKHHKDKQLAISLPSLRIDSFSVHLGDMIQRTRKTGLTFAPEAGSQRLRDVINKGVTEKDIFQTTKAAFENGWDKIKLYFMMGLPTETDQDIMEIVRLIREIRTQGKKIRHRRVRINVSIATFVPKPHTPFQWLPLTSRQVVERRQGIILDNLKTRDIRLSWSDWDSTWLEAILSRGDRRLGAVIHRAWRSGARFEAWNEHFQPALWQKAFSQEGLDPNHYTQRQRAPKEVNPWEIIETGVTPHFLWNQYLEALKGRLSPDCRKQCHNCGILEAFASERENLPENAWGCP